VDFILSMGISFLFGQIEPTAFLLNHFLYRTKPQVAGHGLPVGKIRIDELEVYHLKKGSPTPCRKFTRNILKNRPEN